MKKILLLFLVLFTCQKASNAQEKTNTINIHFDGKDYKNLELIIRLDGGSKKRFAGQSENGKDWTFKYPDSIYYRHKFMSMEVPSKIDTLSETIAFNALIGNDTIRTGSYSFEQGISNIRAVFLGSKIYKNIPFLSELTQAQAFKTLKQDQFLVGLQSDQELLSSIEEMGYGYSLFNRDNPNQLSYEDQLEKYIKITKKYPESHSLVNLLARCLTLYRSRSDVEKVYNCFSDKIKKNYWGKKIDHYIKNSRFSNSALPVWDSDRSEPIIKDTSKYNLIVFSASWCAPCHKMIPVLKEVYTDFTGKFDMVYVSLDEPGTVEAWKILMKKEEIPWRSVLAVKDVKGIKDKYTVQGIPLSLLVHPSGYSEIIDIRKKEDKDKLYRLVLQ